jgi:ubiquinone/menaquinone biosynthesis C-methylase UbiE
MEQNDLQELASQLSHPKGEKGIQVADMMHATNIGMTLHAISSLELSGHEAVLELGHGNGAHLMHILKDRPAVHYDGLEMSELMHEEAKKINAGFIEEQKASFHVYDGKLIPFPDNHFDRIFTVNTIYFWSDPPALLAELYRVLKTGGRLCITFAQESFMKQLPFTTYGFELYSTDKLEKLVSDSPFHILKTESQTEQVMSKMGELMDREFTTVTLQK